MNILAELSFRQLVREPTCEQNGIGNISSLCLPILILMDDSQWINCDLNCAGRQSLLCEYMELKTSLLKSHF